MGNRSFDPLPESHETTAHGIEPRRSTEGGASAGSAPLVKLGIPS